MAGEGITTDIIREQAADWLVQLDGEPTPDQRQAFQGWLSRDNRHRRVFEQMERLWLAASPPKNASHFKPLLSVTGLVLLAALLIFQLPWHYWQADYRTAMGEIHTLTLPDGSSVTLDSNSAIDVAFDQEQRRIELIRGAVLLEVSKDPQRPMVVAVPEGTVQALGTRYSVRRGDDHSVVSVYESQVQVSTADQQTTRVVEAGQQVRLQAEFIQMLAGDLPAYPDWSRKRLVFQDAPMSEVVARLGHYHRGLIHLHSSADNRRFTGALPADDSLAALDLLADSMNLEQRCFSPYVVYLAAADQP
ncbi:MAG: FecR family protein [Porticoccaceae bacterium]|nr:FecR family protein [Porticoccaceae bacterium]